MSIHQVIFLAFGMAFGQVAAHTYGHAAPTTTYGHAASAFLEKKEPPQTSKSGDEVGHASPITTYAPAAAHAAPAFLEKNELQAAAPAEAMMPGGQDRAHAAAVTYGHAAAENSTPRLRGADHRKLVVEA